MPKLYRHCKMSKKHLIDVDLLFFCETLHFCIVCWSNRIEKWSVLQKKSNNINSYQLVTRVGFQPFPSLLLKLPTETLEISKVYELPVKDWKFPTKISKFFRLLLKISFLFKESLKLVLKLIYIKKY